MKLIIAVIRPDDLQAIRDELNQSDAYLMYVSAVGDIHDPLLANYRGSTYHSRVRVFDWKL